MISGNRCAVFTIVRNEATLLPVWLRHYRRFFQDSDIYVLDNDSTDGSTKDLGVSVATVHSPLYMDHQFLLDAVSQTQVELLGRYQYVLFCEVDELLVADPNQYWGLDDFITRLDKPAVKAWGWQLTQDLVNEPGIIDWNRPLFSQRRHWWPDPLYSKTLLASYPLKWIWGFHWDTQPDGNPVPRITDTGLLLVHTHWADLAYSRGRHGWKRAQEFKRGEFEDSLLHHWDDKKIVAEYEKFQNSLQPVPDRFTPEVL